MKPTSSRPPVNYLTFEEFTSLPEEAKATAHKDNPDKVRVRHGLVPRNLLPCPFCGGKASFGMQRDADEPTGRFWVAGCGRHNNCSVYPIATGSTKAEAHVTWNSREKGGAS